MTIQITNGLFGTSPIAAHCPGPLHDRWHEFCRAVMNQPQRHCECPDATVITWNTGARPLRPTKPCGVLERSLELLDIPVKVLGRGQQLWQNRDKLLCTAQALEEITTPYVIGADSADVVFLDNPQIVVDRFRTHFNCQLVFNSTGSRCWPELPELVRLQASMPMAAVARGRHWINSGLFVGETAFMRDYFLRAAQEPPVAGYEASDQVIVMQTWPQWYPRVQADYLSQLFQWFNEDLEVMRLERPTASRQKQLTQWVRRLPMPVVGAEIGVHRGNTAEALLRELPQLALWMVDPWRPFVGQTRFDDQDPSEFEQSMSAAMFWTEFAESRRFVLREPSPQAASRFADASLDFVFIDGDHRYEQVCADLLAWWPKVRPAGLLTGHDYGVYRDQARTWGVKQAVDEFISASDRELILGLDGTWCVVK